MCFLNSNVFGARVQYQDAYLLQYLAHCWLSLVWIKAAQTAIAEAEQTGVKMPELPVIKRQVSKRKTILLENCPQVY